MGDAAWVRLVLCLLTSCASTSSPLEQPAVSESIRRFDASLRAVTGSLQGDLACLQVVQTQVERLRPKRGASAGEWARAARAAESIARDPICQSPGNVPAPRRIDCLWTDTCDDDWDVDPGWARERPDFLPRDP